jgi:hypothetical protein
MADLSVSFKVFMSYLTLWKCTYQKQEFKIMIDASLATNQENFEVIIQNCLEFPIKISDPEHQINFQKFISLISDFSSTV